MVASHVVWDSGYHPPDPLPHQEGGTNMKRIIEAHPQTPAEGALPLWKPRPRWEGDGEQLTEIGAPYEILTIYDWLVIPVGSSVKGPERLGA